MNYFLEQNFMIEMFKLCAVHNIVAQSAQCTLPSFIIYGNIPNTFNFSNSLFF